ncbi:MAG: hypothetical protein ACMG55_07400, partial [Microcoleus sp.]
DSTRYHDLPGNTVPEAEPRLHRFPGSDALNQLLKLMNGLLYQPAPTLQKYKEEVREERSKTSEPVNQSQPAPRSPIDQTVSSSCCDRPLCPYSKTA